MISNMHEKSISCGVEIKKKDSKEYNIYTKGIEKTPSYIKEK